MSNVDEEMLQYETNYAGEPVDFLSSEGPLRADEAITGDYESQQVLTVPPQEAQIWHEWREGERHLGAAAIHLTAAS